jgi:8-oxo-dGTP pyrophosphatase MutT (NUDIX family)
VTGLPIGDFLETLGRLVERYFSEAADRDERLALLRWQIAQRHALDDRSTMPGHVTTSAFVVSPDLNRVLLIHHNTIGRWLQPGGHYEPAASFAASAAREAVEETAIAGLALHPWHGGSDLPFVIDSHEVPGKASRKEEPHYHHDLQYLFVADPNAPLTAQLDEVSGARWAALDELASISPRGLRRLKSLI